MSDRTVVVDEVRTLLAQNGDPERAAGQQRYMKSAMPYHGITSPQLRTLLRPVLAGWRPASRTDWEGSVRELWDQATHREQRYAAVRLARHRVARVWRDAAAMPLWRHLVTTGAWWDLVDEIAAHPVRESLEADPAVVTPLLRDWAVDDDLWLRRTAVIAQLQRAGETDLDLLRFAIEHNVADPSFWLRKAIGWALRQYARTDPDWVRAEVARLEPLGLSTLSRREALKHLG